MLVKLNRFLTTEEVIANYCFPKSLAPKLVPFLPVAHETPDGTRLYLECEVDAFLTEYIRRQRRDVARHDPAPKGVPGRVNDTWEIAEYANELRKKNKTWKQILSACKKRWENDHRVRNANQVRATWNRHFGATSKKAN